MMRIPLITEQPVALNKRLWELARKEADGIATPAETRELDALCATLETGQDAGVNSDD